MNIDIAQLFEAAITAVNVRDFTVSGGIWAFLFDQHKIGNKEVCLKYFKGSERYYDLASVCYENYTLNIPIQLLTEWAIVDFFREGVEIKPRGELVANDDLFQPCLDYKSIFEKLKPQLPVLILRKTPLSWGKSLEEKTQIFERRFGDDTVVRTDDPIRVLESIEYIYPPNMGWRCADETRKVSEFSVLGDYKSSPFLTSEVDGRGIRTIDSGKVIFGGDAVKVYTHGLDTEMYVRSKADLADIVEWQYPPEEND